MYRHILENYCKSFAQLICNCNLFENRRKMIGYYFKGASSLTSLNGGMHPHSNFLEWCQISFIMVHFNTELYFQQFDEHLPIETHQQLKNVTKFHYHIFLKTNIITVILFWLISFISIQLCACKLFKMAFKHSGE